MIVNVGATLAVAPALEAMRSMHRVVGDYENRPYDAMICIGYIDTTAIIVSGRIAFAPTIVMILIDYIDGRGSLPTIR